MRKYIITGRFILNGCCNAVRNLFTQIENHLHFRRQNLLNPFKLALKQPNTNLYKLWHELGLCKYDIRTHTHTQTCTFRLNAIEKLYKHCMYMGGGAYEYVVVWVCVMPMMLPNKNGIRWMHLQIPVLLYALMQYNAFTTIPLPFPSHHMSVSLSSDKM